MIKLKFIIEFLIISALIFQFMPVYALFDDTYRHELKGFCMNEKTTGEKSAENALYGLQYTFNFQEILIEDGPYEELGFIQKASSAYAAAIRGNNKSDSLEADISSFILGVHYIFPEPFIINLLYQKTFADEDTTELKITEDTYTGKFGYYMTDELITYIGCGRVNKKTDIGIYSVSEEEYTNSFLGGFKFVYVINDRLSYNLFGTYEHNRNRIEDKDESVNNIYSMEGDLYPIPQLGLGAGLKINKGDLVGKEGFTFMGRIRVYFFQYIGLNLKYEKFKADDTNKSSDSNYFEIGLTGRL